MAGPTTREALNMEEFSAMAFIRSARPTMSTMNAWRAGISKALTAPSSAESTKMCQIRTVPVSVRAASASANTMDKGLGGDDHALPAVPVGHNAAQGGNQEDRNLAAEGDSAQHNRGPGEPVNQPRLGEVLHPGTDEGDELAREKQLEIAVLQGSQRCGQFWHCFYFKASNVLKLQTLAGADPLVSASNPRPLFCRRRLHPEGRP